jgi:hypothetical protein
MTPPQSKDDILLASLHTFYANPKHLRALTDALNGKAISLRVIDWAVTNYAKRTNSCYLVTRQGQRQSFNMYLEYKSQLKSYSKRLFDPFSRRTRIDFKDADGGTVHTTIGQLNFFKWAISNKVLDYCIQNADTIEKDMLHSIKHRTADETDTDMKPKRRELSKAATKTLTNTKIVLTLCFD